MLKTFSIKKISPFKYHRPNFFDIINHVKKTLQLASFPYIFIIFNPPLLHPFHTNYYNHHFPNHKHPVIQKSCFLASIYLLWILYTASQSFFSSSNTFQYKPFRLFAFKHTITRNSIIPASSPDSKILQLKTERLNPKILYTSLPV